MHETGMAKEASKNQAGPTEKLILWVMENRKEGLVVGHAGLKYTATGSGRYGDGSGASASIAKSYNKAWVPHTSETRDMAVDFMFECALKKHGTIRLDTEMVVPVYDIIAIKKQ